MTRRPFLVVAPMLLTAVLLTGCQVGSSDPFGHDRDGKEQTVTPQDRPPMETMLTRYRAFQADLFAQLDTAFGKRAWYQVPEMGFDRADCQHGELPDGEVASLPDMTFRGVIALASGTRYVTW